MSTIIFAQKPWKDEPIEETIGYHIMCSIAPFLNPKNKDNHLTVNDFAKTINNAGKKMYDQILILQNENNRLQSEVEKLRLSLREIVVTHPIGGWQVQDLQSIAQQALK